MQTDNLLSVAKQSEPEPAPVAVSPVKTLLAEKPFGSIYRVEGMEIPLYEVTGSGTREKITSLLNDGEVESISFGDGVTLSHRKYGAVSTDVNYRQSDLNRALPALGKKFAFKVVNAKTASGQVTLVHKIHPNGLSVIDLINNNGLSLEAAAFLWAAVEGKNQPPANILIASPTALRFEIANALSCFIPASERVSCIGREFAQHSHHWHTAEYSVENAFNISTGTDRVITEAGEDPLPALSILESGVHGILTVSAYSAEHAFEELAKKGRKANTVNLLVTCHSTRVNGKKVNVISSISEVMPFAKPEPRELYAFEKGEMHLQNPFGSFLLFQSMRFGTPRSEVETDLSAKMHILQELNKNGLRSWEDIRRTVTQ